MFHSEKIQLAVVQVASTRLRLIISALLKHILPSELVNKIQMQLKQDQEGVGGAEMVCESCAS